MSVIWKPFEKQMSAHFKKAKADILSTPSASRKKLADKIVSEYDKVMNRSTDMFYRNGIMRTNSGFFKLMLKAGFDILSKIKYYDEPMYEGQLLGIGKGWLSLLTDSIIPYRARVTIEAKNNLISAKTAAVAGATAYSIMNIIQEGVEIIIRMIAPLISEEEERQEWLDIIDSLEEIELKNETAIQAEVDSKLTEAKSSAEKAKEVNANDAALEKATAEFKKELDARHEQLKEDTKRVPEIIIKKSLAAVGDMLATVAFRLMANGLILNWTGATLKTTVPPPGATKAVANVVLVPFVDKGKIIKEMKKAQQQESEKDMIDTYVKLFREHSKTLSGITVGIVPLVGIPTPIPYPWVGLTCSV